MNDPIHLTGLPPRAALAAVRNTLEEAGVPDAFFDARELYRLAVGKDPRLDESPLTAEKAAVLAEFAARRAGREPLQYIAGQWDFLDFTLTVGPGVLCPRADTEIVCETAVELLQGMDMPDPEVLDLCAGTGCLGLGVKRSVPGARVTCWEKSPEALPYLRQNARQALPGAAVCVREGDVLTGWREVEPGSIDLIVSNPPYLTGEEMAGLMPETALEPAMALDGGADGLRFYRCLTGPWQRALKPGGWLVLEIGWQQRRAVLELGEQNGWIQSSCRRDYGGNDRVILLRKPAGLG